MFTFLIVALVLTIGVPIAFAFMRFEEIKANWDKYRTDPFYMFASPLFKPADDPRSPAKYGADTVQSVLIDMMNKAYGVFLTPLFKIFRMLLDGANEATAGLYNLRGTLAMFWQQWLNITDVFNQRALRTAHSLRMTFVRLYTMLTRAYGAAVSSLYAGMSAISSVLSTFDLIVKVAVIVILILAGMMLFFFFVLWPLIPLIMVAIAVVAATPMGDSIGSGTIAAFCFGGETRVKMANGTTMRIDSLPLGAALQGGRTVTGLLHFQQARSAVYALDGVRVAGDHIVFTQVGGWPRYVKDCEGATLLPSYEDPIYCLMTSDRRIPIVGDSGFTWTYADWEEIEKTTTELHAWHAFVDGALNGARRSGACEDAATTSTPAFDGEVRVETETAASLPISEVRPGMKVRDAGGAFTTVLGVVRVGAAEVQTMTESGASAGVWTASPPPQAGAPWIKARGARTAADPSKTYYNLFTESGTFLANGAHFRDFSEVGMGALGGSYDQVLNTLTIQRLSAATPLPNAS
jgi:hypothetical protein